MSLVKFPKSHKIGRVRLARNPHGAGWLLTVDIGPGAGYRWMDFGPYKQSIYGKWYNHLTISGRTLRLGYKVKSAGIRKNWGGHWFTRKCNIPLYPGWWA